MVRIMNEKGTGFKGRIGLYRMKTAMVRANFISNAIGVGVALLLFRDAP